MARGDGSGLRQLSAGEGAASSPSISADGSLAAFAQDGQIWVARTDEKSTAAPLTSYRVSVAQDPVVSDDGTRVAFSLGPRARTSAQCHLVFCVVRKLLILVGQAPGLRGALSPAGPTERRPGRPPQAGGLPHQKPN